MPWNALFTKSNECQIKAKFEMICINTDIIIQKQNFFFEIFNILWLVSAKITPTLTSPWQLFYTLLLYEGTATEANHWRFYRNLSLSRHKCNQKFDFREDFSINSFLRVTVTAFLRWFYMYASLTTTEIYDQKGCEKHFPIMFSSRLTIKRKFGKEWDTRGTSIASSTVPWAFHYMK